MSVFQEGYINKVYYRYFSVENAVANVVAIHGLGGHCIWFDNSAALFNRSNINFFSFDLPGFGQSKYEIGSISSYNEWIDVSFDTIKKFLIDFGVRKPVFILGHSMGTLIALKLSEKIKANGWVFSVPGFVGNPEMWPFSKLVLPLILKALFSPNKLVTLPFGPEAITRNKETQQKLKEDKLRVVSPKASLFLQVHLLTKAAMKLAEKFTEKFILLEAGKDMVCSNEAMDKFYNLVQSKDKTKKIYYNAYHDLFIEPEVSLLVDDVSLWIKSRV